MVTLDEIKQRTKEWKFLKWKANWMPDDLIKYVTIFVAILCLIFIIFLLVAGCYFGVFCFLLCLALAIILLWYSILASKKCQCNNSPESDSCFSQKTSKQKSLNRKSNGYSDYSYHKLGNNRIDNEKKKRSKHLKKFQPPPIHIHIPNCINHEDIKLEAGEICKYGDQKKLKNGKYGSPCYCKYNDRADQVDYEGNVRKQFSPERIKAKLDKAGRADYVENVRKSFSPEKIEAKVEDRKCGRTSQSLEYKRTSPCRTREQNFAGETRNSNFQSKDNENVQLVDDGHTNFLYQIGNEHVAVVRESVPKRQYPKVIVDSKNIEILSQGEPIRVQLISETKCPCSKVENQVNESPKVSLQNNHNNSLPIVPIKQETDESSICSKPSQCSECCNKRKRRSKTTKSLKKKSSGKPKFNCNFWKKCEKLFSSENVSETPQIKRRNKISNDISSSREFNETSEVVILKQKRSSELDPSHFSSNTSTCWEINPKIDQINDPPITGGQFPDESNNQIAPPHRWKKSYKNHPTPLEFNNLNNNGRHYYNEERYRDEQHKHIFNELQKIQDELNFRKQCLCSDKQLNSHKLDETIYKLKSILSGNIRDCSCRRNDLVLQELQQIINEKKGMINSCCRGVNRNVHELMNQVIVDQKNISEKEKLCSTSYTEPSPHSSVVICLPTSTSTSFPQERQRRSKKKKKQKRKKKSKRKKSKRKSSSRSSRKRKKKHKKYKKSRKPSDHWDDSSNINLMVMSTSECLDIHRNKSEMCCPVDNKDIIIATKAIDALCETWLEKKRRREK